MSEKFITIRVPVTMKIGPVPESIDGPSGIFSFGIQNFGRVLSERGVVADISGEHAVATFALRDENAKSQTARGLVLDDRVFRIQAASNGQHQLETSTDLGETFNVAGTFTDYGFARAIGDAWVDGRVEQAA
jgi:hypothetical protein